MTRFPRAIMVLAASGLVAIGSGCEGGKPAVDSSTEEATVKGVVTFKGKAVTKGEIAFDPSNYQRKMAAASRAPIGADGRYSIKTLVGENKVSFAIPETARDPKLQDLMLPRVIKSGENTLDFELPPPPSNP